MATLKKVRRAKTPEVRAPRRTGKPAAEAVGWAVFLEHEAGSLEPVKLRDCANEFEAIGYRECWLVDRDILEAKVVARQIDANGRPVGRKAGEE